jgi:hypothetical protein
MHFKEYKMPNSITPIGRASYMHILEPQPIYAKNVDPNAPKVKVDDEFSITVIFNEYPALMWQQFQEEMDKRWPNRASTGITIRSPFRQGIQGSYQTNGGYNLIKNPEYAGKVMVRFGAKMKGRSVVPDIVDKYNRRLDRNNDNDRKICYSGCDVQVGYTIFGYEGKGDGGPGVSFGLATIRIAGDNIPFVAQHNAEDDFAGVAENPADNEAMFANEQAKYAGLTGM